MNKNTTQFWLMLIFLSPFILYSLAYHIYCKVFDDLNGLTNISIEQIDHIRFFVETSLNIFFVILLLYLAALYYLMKRQKNRSSSE